MVDTMKKNLSDADGRKAWQESVAKTMDVAREQAQNTVLQKAQEMLWDLKQSLSQLPDRMKELFAREKTEFHDRISHLDHEQSQEIGTQLLGLKNDLNVLQTSIKKTTLQKKSEVYSPYITPPIKERIASLWEQGSQWRTVAYGNVASYANTVSQSNPLVHYLLS